MEKMKNLHAAPRRDSSIQVFVAQVPIDLAANAIEELEGVTRICPTEKVAAPAQWHSL